MENGYFVCIKRGLHGKTKRSYESGETSLEAAKRELYEETGAVDFDIDIEPLCDYYINGEQNGWNFKGNGQVYFAIIHAFERIASL